VIHEGRFSYKGHYFAYVKGFDSKWYKWDDSWITKIEDTDEILSSCPYILFYRMRLSCRKTYLTDISWEHQQMPKHTKKHEQKQKMKSSPCRKRKKAESPRITRSSKLLKTKIHLPFVWRQDS
jgi:hypothetical protein